MTTRKARTSLLIQLVSRAGRSPLAIAAALPLALAGHATAQDYEYEPDEGWHEEEWYDPSDWFNDDQYSIESDWYEDDTPGDQLPDADEYRSDRMVEGSLADHREAYLEGYRAGFSAEEFSINYSEVEWERPYTSSYSTGFYDGWEDSHGDDTGYGASFQDETERGFSVGYGSLHHDAYYDGYYDGFHDDEFGSDHYDGSWEAPYGTSYTSGYYDGFYDANRDYSFDPTYYVVMSTVTTTGEADEKRAEDQSRKRGDRASRGDMSGRQAMTGERKRGTVEGVSEAEVEGRPEGHLLLELTMEDDEKVIADFGPRATRERLPFSEGDRITLVGETETEGDKEVLVVKKVIQGKDQMVLRGPSRAMAMQQGQRQDRVSYNGQRQQRGWEPQNTRDRQQGMRSERGSPGDWRQGAQESRQMATLQGRMSSVHWASRDVDGYRVFRVRMDDGRTVLLAMDARGASQVRMREGDEVQIRGRWATIDGQRMVEVHRMRSRSGN